MDFLGIGVWEFFVIILLALIFVGPRDLPRLAARAGKFVRDLRMMSEGFTTEWRRELAALNELEEFRELKEELISTKEILQDAGREIRTSMRVEPKDLEPDPPQKPEAQPPPAASTKGSASTKPAVAPASTGSAETPEEALAVADTAPKTPDLETPAQEQPEAAEDEDLKTKVQAEAEAKEARLAEPAIHPQPPPAAIAVAADKANQAAPIDDGPNYNGRVNEEVEVQSPETATVEERSARE